MAKYSSLLSFSLGFVILFHSCFAQIEQVTTRGNQQQQQQQRFQTQCQIQRLNALRPQQRIQSEAGVTEFWDSNNQQLQCANVAVVRHTIQQRGLLLPLYTNTPQLIYVVQGRGIQGTVFSGCPETYESGQQSQQSQWGSSGTQDQHQKVREFREGHIIALPAGAAHWIYNNGQSPLVLVSLFDVGNFANQLDQFLRPFFLAGNLQRGFQGGSQGQGQQQQCNNIFSGFDEQLLAEAFNVDTQLVRRLQRQNSQRGIIIRVQQDLQLLSPKREFEQRQQQGGGSWDNGLEETLCTMRLHHNINDPSSADVFNPRGGRVTSVNSLTLPILRHLQLSAEKGVLYSNAILAPHWNVNAHSIVYITRGNGRIQIVSDSGDNVFDGQIQEGQLIVVPQNFAVVKQAGNQGFEWIAFKTNGEALISQLSGRASVIRGLPVDVIANAYQISREDAQRLKHSRQEMTVLSPRSQRQ